MFLNKWMIKIIRLYQKDKDKPHRCRHIPSCSNYGLACYEKFNFIKASFLTGYRILRCNPLSHNIFDPVPLSKDEKKQYQSYQEKASIIDANIITYFENNENLIFNMNNAITRIWEKHFGCFDSVDLSIIDNDHLMLFYAMLDRILFFVKKKKNKQDYKTAKIYLNKYVFSDISKHPKFFIHKMNV